MDIKRYDVGGDYGYGYCDEEEQGDWVLFDDHGAVVASLQADLTKALGAITKIATWPDGGNAYGQDKIKAFANRILSGTELHKATEIAHQSPPSAKDLTKQPHNQCDGCQAGIPVEVNQYGTPLHRMGSEGKYPDYMACTAKLYAED